MFIEHHPIIKKEIDYGFINDTQFEDETNSPVNCIFPNNREREKMFAANRRAPNSTFLARPIQIDEHNVAKSRAAPPPPPPAAPPPPVVPQQSKAKTSKKAAIAVKEPAVFDRDKLLSEVRSGVQLRHTVTNDKSAPIGVGHVRSGGYSPPPDSVASTSTYSNRPAAKKPVFYGQHIDDEPAEPVAPRAPPPPKAPPPAALLKLGGSTNFDRDKLLGEIQGGVRLRKTVTNDRSAPIGVGTVRNDLSPSSRSPNSETSAASTSASYLGATPPAPPSPVPPPPPSPSAPPPPPSSSLASQQEHHKPAKPITNPALLKLGGKQPVDRDALLASIRGGVKLRKVETNDRSSPFPTSRDASPDRLQAPQEPAVAPPPPPLLVPPPPVPSAEPIRRSRSPNPALSKLGGKVTIGRDELMRSIRQGVKLRKVVTNDKSSAIINDDDSGVKSPGRSSPSTSNYEDDVYGSQSLSDLSSIGTSRFSSLSNIPPAERPNDLYVASPAAAVADRIGTKGATPGSISSYGSSRPQMFSVNVDVENYGDEDIGDDEEEAEVEEEAVALQSPQKPKADECYTSPIPTREQIEAEIPAGSARERIKLFGGTTREESHSPVRSVSKSRKKETEVENSEFGVARVRKLFADAAAGQPSAPAPAPGRRNEEREKAAAAGSGENSIRKMVRKFSTDDEASKTTSQPIWCQKRADEKPVETEKKIKRKSSGTKGSMRKKSSTKEPGLRRKSSTKTEVAPTATISTKARAAPTKPKELAPETPSMEEDAERRKGSATRGWTPPKVDISKFKERFENPPSDAEQSNVIRRGSTTSEDTAKPGRIKKPPWLKETEPEVPPLPAPAMPRKTEETPRPSWKKTRAPELPSAATEPEKASKKPPRAAATTTKPFLKKQESSDHEESPEPVEPPASTRTGTTGIVTKKATRDIDQAPPIPTSSPPKIPGKKIVHVPLAAEELPAAEVPTREGVGPYRYVRKNSGTADKKPITRKSSTGSKKNSVLGSGGNLLNSVPKPFGAHLTTTGETTTIGSDADDSGTVKEEPKVPATGNRQFVFKPKYQPPKVATAREREQAFGDKTTTTRTAKTTAETTDGLHYANIGIAVSTSSRIYAVPITAPWNHPDSVSNLSSSSSSSSCSSFLSNGSGCRQTTTLRHAGNYCLSPVTGREYPNLWHQNNHQLQQKPQQSQELPPREWNGMLIGRARRVIVGEPGEQVYGRSGDGFQRSFNGNDPCESQHERLEEHFFRQNYRFEIDLENDQQPLRIVHR